MGDPSFGPLHVVDFGVVSQSPLSHPTGIHPFLRAPLLGLLPSLVAFVSSLPVAPHAEAQGHPQLSFSTGGLSY